ncbi:MAG: AraC family transcriptional regulator [Cyanobacteriota bacterium]|nr:AraC family transcriptional regulator [Cyanobacteriota bacterium]
MLLSRPLLFRSDLAITDTCVEALAQKLSLGMNLRDFDHVGPRDEVLYRASTVSVGEMIISTGFHSPMRVVTDATPRATVILALGGETDYIYDDGDRLRFGQFNDLAYLPGRAFVEHASWISGVLFSVDVERLTQTATAMAGFRAGTRLIRQRLEQPQLVRPQPHSRGMEVVEHLHRLFGMLDAPNLEQDQLLELLGLEDLLYRAMAVAFCGDLIRVASCDVGTRRSTKAVIIDELLEWIRANLDRPISLTELERQSAYSQRTLRTAFQQRFGCGPNEWIRKQRMEAARRQLLQPQPGDSVSLVARRCGYSHLSQFSRDFHRTFGLSPSGVLRQGRAGLT